MNEESHYEFTIFTEAAALPAGQRDAYLASRCGGNKDLLRRVTALLAADARAGSFLQTAIGSISSVNRNGSPVGEKLGDRIGHFKLLQQIGEGGCGVVFMAQQEEPIRRKVALKIVKPGMDTKSVIALFEAERQALALMDHPSIAKVFDAGATASGRPYFVMELIRGVKITDYCDANSLSTEERLDLFIQVCHAIQHAHQKGLIHRDIKPSNILVTTTEDGAPLPVVIDFGIAKATANQELTDKTVFTAFEMLIGTPAYMSPEQATLSNSDVDTRTDIYSLGVLLYELLTGSTPFHASELLKAGFDEIRRIIREEEPIRPSTKLSRMTSVELSAVAHTRKSDAPRLIRAISGDLDWIVMRALEKSRARRYETANGLALDVRRFLSNEPILARPPSRLYRFQKIFLRNKTLFLAAGILLVLLITSLILVSASLARETEAREEALRDQQKAEQVTRFLEQMLQGVEPSVALGRDTEMLREILDLTAERVGTELKAQPEVEAELRRIIGRLYLQIGSYESSETMHRAELAVRQRISGLESEEAAATYFDLADACWRQRKLTEAEAAHATALAIRRRLYGDEHPDVGASLNGLGAVYRRQKRLAEAEELTRQGLAIRRKLLGNAHLHVADSLRNLSIILADRGNRADAENVAREMLAIRRKLLSDNHPLVASAVADLAWVVGFTRKAESESLDIEAFVLRKKVLPEEHPDIAKSIYLIGERLRQKGDLSESHLILSTALSVQRKLLGDDHPDVLATLRGVALALETQGKFPEAERIRRIALSSWRKRSGGEDPQALEECEGLIRALIAQKKVREAEEVANEVLTPAFLKKPASSKILYSRFELKARQGRWQEAAADGALLIELQPAEHFAYHIQTPFLVMTQHRSSYVTHCERLVRLFGNSINPYIAERVVKDCLIWPPAPVDFDVLNHLADLAVIRGTTEVGMPSFQVAKALSTLRQNRFKETIDWATKARDRSHIYVRGHACALLAIAHWKLGSKQEARAMLAEGNILAPRISFVPDADNLGDDWIGWLFARILLEEAASIIDPVSRESN